MSHPADESLRVSGSVPRIVDIPEHQSRKLFSATLNADIVTWLKGRVSAARVKSVIELLDQLVTAWA